MCLMSIYGLWQCFSVIPVLCMVFLVYWNNGEIAIKTFKQSSNDIVLFYAFPGGGSCFGILRNPVHEEEKQELFPA